MDTHYDAVIVGSGFGGSVMAFRLAEAGLKVLLLERGKPFAPGSFPRSPAGLRQNFWNPEGGAFGMFHPWSFRGLESVSAAGLGGGSLVYANALLRKDEKTFQALDPLTGRKYPWPLQYRDVDAHYTEVERWLGATPYPFKQAPYNATAKTQALRDAALAKGLKWGLPNLAVTFGADPANPRPGQPLPEAAGQENLHGVYRRSCTLCGECDLGCNEGAKNTLDLNYLSAAKRAGLEIRTGIQVRRVQPRDGGGYQLSYFDHNPAMQGRAPDTQHHTLTAERVVLAAGTFGTTHLLLKSREQLRGLSPMLGERFSGNGDILSFVQNVREEKNGELIPRSVDPTRGPVLTSAIYGEDFVIQEGGFPPMVAWLAETFQPSILGRLLHLGIRVASGWLGLNRDSDLSAELAAAIGDASFTDRTLLLMGIGTDVADGKLHLGPKGLELDWKPDRSRAYFDRVLETGRRIAAGLHGDFVPNPSWKLGRVITPHPIGGAPMGSNPTEGVVDGNGEVFGHPGLYVADGSVMPASLGVNPSLTIAAVSDLFADRMLTRISTKRSLKPRVRPAAQGSVQPTT